MRKYRVNRDKWVTWCWSVECWRPWWPFWTQDIGQLDSEGDAIKLKEILEKSND